MLDWRNSASNSAAAIAIFLFLVSPVSAQDGGFDSGGFDGGEFAGQGIGGDGILPTLGVNIDLRDPAVVEELARDGALVAIDDAVEWREINAALGRDWPSELAVPIDDTVNPFFDEDIWDRFRDLGFMLMPVGPDGTQAPVRLGAIGGAAIHLSDPGSLDWNGGLIGDHSCFVPPVVDAGLLGPQVNSARLQSVLVAGLGGIIEPGDDGETFVYRSEVCSPATAMLHVLHCSGLLEPDGRTVWTAAHCLRAPDLRFFQPPLGELVLGQSLRCPPEANLRVVSLLGLVSQDFVVPKGAIGACESLTLVGPDIARIHLAAPLPVTPIDGIMTAPWRHPAPGELERILTDGRRLYGTGFPQTPELRESLGGRIMPMEHCLGTLAGRLGFFRGRPTQAEIDAAVAQLRDEMPDGAITYGGYGCTSMDTMNGGSGGAVFALDEAGTDLVLAGVVSAAAWVTFDMECQVEQPTPLGDDCGVAPSGGLNLFALLPADLSLR